MRRAAVAILAGALLAVVLPAVALPAVAAGRRHRLHVPPAELPHSLSVDEKEWAVQPSQTLVAAGVVRFNAYNRGEDSHNFVIVDAAGRVEATTSLLPGVSATVTTRLHPGTYVLFCSLFAGTPESHYARGMHATITVR
jgi:plastocyanin